MPRKDRIKLPMPPDTDTMIFRVGFSWIKPWHVALHLRDDLDEDEVVFHILQTEFPIPYQILTKNSRPPKHRFYRTDFMLALFGLEGKFCVFCLNPLGHRQYRACSRKCVSRYDQIDEESTIEMTLDVDGQVALKLFRMGLQTSRVPQGMASNYLKDRVEVAFKAFGDFLISVPRIWEGRPVE